MAEQKITLKIEGGTEQTQSKSDKTIGTYMPKTAASMSKMVGVLGAIAGSVYLLKGASQHLQGTFEIFKRAFQLVLKPLGDFISMLLRPLAIMLLRWVKGVLGVKSKEEIQKTQEEATTKIGSGDIETTLEGINDWWNSLIDSLMLKFNPESMAEKLVLTLLEMVLKLPTLIADALYFVFFKVPQAIGDAIAWLLTEFFKFFYDIGEKIGEQISELSVKIAGWIMENLIIPIMEFFYNIYLKISEIVKNIKTWVKTNITDPIVNFFKSLFTEISNTAKSIADWVKTNLYDPIKDFFKQLKDVIMGYVNRILSMFSGRSSSSGGGGGGSVQDAVITPSGQVIKTSPSDYLIATKKPEDLFNSGGGVKTINVNVSIEKVDSEMRIRELTEKISEELSRRINYMAGE